MFSFHFLLIITVAVVSIIAFPESEAATKDASVIILGAGVAGIQAAAQLTQQGITDILIIESTGRIGGRMWNEEWEGLTIELGTLIYIHTNFIFIFILIIDYNIFGFIFNLLGCNWIEGTPLSENPLWTIAQKINLQGASTQQEDTPLMYDHLGKADTKITKDIWTRLNSALAATYIESLQRQWNNRPDLSLREALTSNGWKPTTALERVAYVYIYLHIIFTSLLYNNMH